VAGTRGRRPGDHQVATALKRSQLTEQRPPPTSLAPAPPLPGLGPLALARGTLDRATEHRTDPEWLARAWADPGSRVLVVDHGRALVRFGPPQPELVLIPPAQAPEGPHYLLGVDGEGRAYFSVRSPLPTEPAPDGARPADLRQSGALLGDRDSGLLTHAVALDNWHATHKHCPRCGALTDVVTGGHSRVCPVDGSEHFPRTDPAVITLVTDAADRALLARNTSWPEHRVSILAGFVDPGESAEQAVVREVAEETGVVVGEVRYLGSQPWPMPRSLMLGFWARAAGRQPIHVDEEEIAEAHWFSRDGLRASMAAGEIRLPPPVSIAHRIIESWYGAELPAQW
jgi:NAD+ diphosphatase